MFIRWFLALLCVLASIRVFAQESELDECLDAGSFCNESAPILMDESCGEKFYRFRGRIAWKPLLNVGPVTVSVRTRSLAFKTVYPLYLEIEARRDAQDSTCVR